MVAAVPEPPRVTNAAPEVRLDGLAAGAKWLMIAVLVANPRVDVGEEAVRRHEHGGSPEGDLAGPRRERPHGRQRGVAILGERVEGGAKHVVERPAPPQ